MKQFLFRLLYGSRGPEAKMAFYLFRQRFCQSFLARKYWWSDYVLMQKRNLHVGETCVIVGNGPSLGSTDTRLLAGKHSFGMNRIYLGFEELGFVPSFYVCVNKLVIEQCWDDICRLEMPKFLSSHAGVRDRRETDAVFLRTNGGDLGRSSRVFFSTNPLRGVWESATVTYVAMQLAYWMGFQKVVLIGVDHNFVTKGEPNREVISEGDDPNHFSGKYFGKGFRWQLPDLETSELGYRMADFCYRSAGREIVDCTVDGKCPVFRKGELGAEL